MTFTFPQFLEPIAIDAHRSWMAEFDSYDQRNENVYYVVAVRDGEREVAHFTVEVWLDRMCDDWTGFEFAECLRLEIHRSAVAGKANTGYVGRASRLPRASDL
jgi:hypothetical protein